MPAEKPFLHEGVDKHQFQIKYSFKKSVSGTCHLGNLKYGETSEIQCTSNAFFVIFFSAIKTVNLEVLGFGLFHLTLNLKYHNTRLNFLTKLIYLSITIIKLLMKLKMVQFLLLLV